jgi:hypothetical protein
VTSNIRSYGGAQQKKCNAKSDDEWDLPHDTAPPCVFALSHALPPVMYAEVLSVSRQEKVAGPKPRAFRICDIAVKLTDDPFSEDGASGLSSWPNLSGGSAGKV